MLTEVNDRTRNRAGSITGLGWRRESPTNASRATAAAPNALIVRPDVQPQSLDCTSPRTSAPTETASSRAPTRSGRGAPWLWRTSGTRRTAAIRRAAPTGTLIQNAQCHDSWTSTPPVAGPSAAAMAPVSAQTRAPAARRSGGQRGEQEAEAGRGHHRSADGLHHAERDEHPHAVGYPQARLARVNSARPVMKPPFWP